MTCADAGDAVTLGYLSLDDLSRTDRTAVCRANGWDDEIIRTAASQASRKPRPVDDRPVKAMPGRCEQTGCESFVRTGQTHCPSHAGSEMPF